MFSINHLDIIDFIPAIPLWKLVLIPIPPIISFTNWFDFNSAIIEPTSKVLLKSVLEFSFIKAYGISIITDITTWRIRREEKLLNQLLKNPSVEELLRHNIANGDNNTNTFITIYLNAKLIIRAKEEIESIPESIPSKEKASKEFVEVSESIDINVTKDIWVPNIFFPSEQKNVLIRLMELIINEQIWIEKLAQIPDKNALIKNLGGDSIFAPVSWDMINLTT